MYDTKESETVVALATYAVLTKSCLKGGGGGWLFDVWIAVLDDLFFCAGAVTEKNGNGWVDGKEEGERKIFGVEMKSTDVPQGRMFFTYKKLRRSLKRSRVDLSARLV